MKADFFTDSSQNFYNPSFRLLKKSKNDKFVRAELHRLGGKLFSVIGLLLNGVVRPLNKSGLACDG